ncbi:MAG: succinate--CoA ligase subunit alpha [Candidatus Thermoplasmatota archaeon]|nr:succinate--CoA ligase subunit alpha [Candidatus Thermoplasmatota archaeon]
MAVLVDRNTKLLIQGITGKQARNFLADIIKYGTKVVAGISPGREGQEIESVPIYDSVRNAVKEHGANTALVMVSGERAYDAVLEDINAGIHCIVCVADPVPVHHMLRLKWILEDSESMLIGPNTPGVISPGKSKVGFMPSASYSQGNMGVVSRSGSLSYEICSRLTEGGIGQSTVIGIGGDPIQGLDMLTAVKLLDDDPETSTIFLITEIGGEQEYGVAEAVSNGSIRKPVFAFIAGKHAPEGRKMGHTAALISKRSESHAAKMKAMEKAGINVIRNLSDIVGAVS